MRRDGLNSRACCSRCRAGRDAPALALLVAACGSSKSNAGNDAQGAGAQRLSRRSRARSPATPAPPLALHNYLGQPVNIDSYRGKAVLVTFIYTHCPDVCPLITSNLRVAQNLMGPKVAAKAQIIAVSVDPEGRHAQDRRALSSRQHEMTGRMQYLIGSAHELARVWKAWGVGSERDAEQPGLRRALRPDLRDHRLGQAHDALLGRASSRRTSRTTCRCSPRLSRGVRWGVAGCC